MIIRWEQAGAPTDPVAAFAKGAELGALAERDRIAAILRATPGGERLLKQILPPQRIDIPEGTREANCRSCAAPIFWVKTAAGKNMPVDPDGISHFATCPDAAKHRRPG